MRHSRAFAGLIISLPLALAACSGGDADADADGAISNDEAMAEMQQGPDITLEPGQWEQSVSFSELEMPGAPEAVQDMMRQSMTANVTSQSCLGPDEVAKPDADFFAGQGNGNCTYQEFDRDGSRLRMRMTCEDQGQGSTTIAMDGNFGPAEYAFDLETKVQGTEGPAMSMKGRISAKRVGECPA